MVVAIRGTASSSENSQNIVRTENIGNRTDSLYSYNTDTDLLRRETASRSENSQNIVRTENIGNRTATLHSYNTDPDLFIREYFLSSSDITVKTRKNIARNIKSLRPFIEILKWTVSNKARDAHDKGLDLLTEINDIKLLIDACTYLETTNELLMNLNDTKKFFRLDLLWEILIKCIAYSHKIPLLERLELLNRLYLTVLGNRAINRRIIKASLIDAFMSFSDEISTDSIEIKIKEFASLSEKDQYIRNYAKEALQELR